MPFDGASLNPAAAYLFKARSKVAKKWCQKEFFEDGAVCILGALGYRTYSSIPDSSYYDTPRGRAATLLNRAIGTPPRYEHDPSKLFEWNDKPERTQDEVLEVFDKAIALSFSETAPYRR